MPTDAADLFCEIFDQFEVQALAPREVDDWLTDPTISDIASFTEGQVLETGTLDEEEVWSSIEFADEPDRRRFAFLQGIDNALLHAHPQTASHDSAGLTAIATRYAETGRFSSAGVPGALLPRFAFPAGDESPAESLGDAMISVVRVPADTWERTEHLTMPGRSDLHRRSRELGVVFGCVPMLESLEELEWTRSRAAGRVLHRSEAIASEEFRERISRVLRRLDAEGAMVAVLPELCASDQILRIWQEVLRDQPAPRESKLRWILIGSGPLEGDVEVPANTAAMLDRLTGQVLLRQDKLHPFTFGRPQLEAWGMAEYAGAEASTEDIRRGERITVVETALGRLAVLICEDLARTIEEGPALLDHGMSHALCPVFSDEIKEHHWEHNHAKDYAESGVQVVISNSRAIETAKGATSFGTALAHSPHDTSVGTTSAADEVVLFRVSDEAAVNAVARTAGFEDFEGDPY